MKRIKQLAAALVMGVLLAPGFASADADPTENRAVQVDIFGMGPPVDGQAYLRVRHLLGQGVAEGMLDKFVVYGYGIEGGFSACVELSKFRDSTDVNVLMDELNRIKPNPQTTSYHVEAKVACKNPSP